MNKLCIATVLLLFAVAAGQAGPLDGASYDNFDRMNVFRTSNGRTTLGWSSELFDLAMGWSNQMYNERRMYHSNYDVWENVAYAYNRYTPATVGEGFHVQWVNSPDHHDNMLLTTHTCGAAAIYGDENTFYGTQMFLSDCSSPVTRMLSHKSTPVITVAHIQSGGKSQADAERPRAAVL